MGKDRLHDGVVVQVEPAEVVEEGDGEGQSMRCCCCRDRA